MTPQPPQFCKKISYTDGYVNGLPNSRTILGLIENEDIAWLYVRTARTQYKISKTAILAIMDTSTPFQEAVS